jgi:two-component sensor histidine kinase
MLNLLSLILFLAVPFEQSIIYPNGFSDDAAFMWSDTLSTTLVLAVDEAGTYVIQGAWEDRYINFDMEGRRICSKCQSATLNLEKGKTELEVTLIPVKNIGNRYIAFTLLTQEQYLLGVSDRKVFQTLFFSVSALLVFYSLVYFGQTKHILGVFYAVYLVLNALFFGFNETLIARNTNWIASIPPVYAWIFSNLVTASYLAFMRSFLDLQRTNRTFLIIGYAIAFEVILFAFEFITELLGYSVQQSEIYKLSIIGTEIILSLYIIYCVVRINTLLSRIMIIGSSVLLVGSMSLQFSTSIETLEGINNFPFLMQTAVLIEIIIFSLGIGVHVRLLDKKRKHVQDELIKQLQENEQMKTDNMKMLEELVEKRTKDLTQKVAENDLLLKEVHHRVKNNLQMVSSILSLQGRRLADSTTTEVLRLTKNRIGTIGLIHEYLYSHESLTTIHIEQYVTQLVEMILKSAKTQVKPHVTYRFEINELGLDIMIPVALILNELITNSLKYAFYDQQNPEIVIEVFRKKSELTIAYKDNGQGVSQLEKGFGWTIIDSLVAGHSGKSSWCNNQGFNVLICLSD